MARRLWRLMEFTATENRKLFLRREIEARMAQGLSFKAACDSLKVPWNDTARSLGLPERWLREPLG